MTSEKYRETEAERDARWRRFDSLTDKDIKAAIADDPDWQGVDLSNPTGWHVVRADGHTIVPIKIDARTARFFSEHHVNYQTFLSGVLKAFVASQEKPRE